MSKVEKSEVFYGKTYTEIWEWFKYKHVGQGRLTEHEAYLLHLKWKRLAAEV